jgi:hypothetical protein
MTIFTTPAERRPASETLKGRRGDRAAAGDELMADEPERHGRRRSLAAGSATPGADADHAAVGGHRGPASPSSRSSSSSFWLPIHYVRPAALARLGATLERGALKGAQPLRLERLLRLPLRLFAAAGMCREALVLPLPEGLAGRATFGGSDQVAEPARPPSARARPLAGIGPGIPTTGSVLTSTTRATWTRCR